MRLRQILAAEYIFKRQMPVNKPLDTATMPTLSRISGEAVTYNKTDNTYSHPKPCPHQAAGSRSSYNSEITKAVIFDLLV